MEVIETIPYAIAGGGPDSGIGDLHRQSAKKVGLELVAGTFSMNLDRHRKAVERLHLAERRCNVSLAELVAAESARPKGARLLVVCTPHVFHASAVLLAIEAGWHVICEKPLCVLEDELESFSALALDQRQRVTIPFVMRYFPGLLRLKAQLNRGDIGEIQWMSVRYLQSRGERKNDWRFQRNLAGPSGTLADLGPHVLDLCKWLFNDEIEVTDAKLRTLDASHEIDDSAWLWVKNSRGVEVNVALCQAVVDAQTDCSIEIYGRHGTLKWTLCEEALAGGGIEHLFASAFDAFYLDVALWRSKGKPLNLPTWRDGEATVRSVKSALEKNSSNYNKSFL